MSERAEESAASSGYRPAAGQAQLYGDDYFTDRYGNDPRRRAQFLLEGAWLQSYCPSGRIMDVGCSTGEFLSAIDWRGERYGMEISEHARRLAEASGIRFHPDLFEATEYFDCVLYRGTIQHLDEPFRFIKQTNRALKPGGWIVFLATPNTNAPLYRLKKRLPFTVPERNFYLPDDVTLPNALRNFGFEVREMRFPYWRSPYRRLVRDHLAFLRNLVSPGFHPHAFWRSSMELIAQKVASI